MRMIPTKIKVGQLGQQKSGGLVGKSKRIDHINMKDGYLENR